MDRFQKIIPIFILVFSAAAAWPNGLSRRERIGFVEKAMGLMGQNKFSAAAENFEQALSEGVSRADRLRWLPLLGSAYENAGSLQKALSVFQAAYEKTPKIPARRLDLARVYDKVDLRSSAIPLYEAVLKEDPRRREVCLALADLYFRSGEMNSARRYAEEAVASQPQDMAAQRLLAQIEEKEGELSVALRRWRDLLPVRPDPADFVHVGDLEVRQGEFDLAREFYKRAQALGFSRGGCEMKLGFVSWLEGKNAEARALWKSAETKIPGSTMPRFFLALANFEEGRKTDARDLMEDVLRKTQDPTVKFLGEEFVISLSSP